MTHFDYAILGLYFSYILVIGWVFRRFVQNVSDYFRGGGKALWWMVGGSGFLAAFSAWTFTGAASEAYGTGWPVMVIYVGNAASFLLSALYFGPKFRQMRVITVMEAVRHRFGRVSEQVFTWLQMPLGTLQAAVWLSSIGVFYSAVFGVDLTLTIVTAGTVVLLVALVGGNWAVLASDFIQVLILMPVCIVLVVFSLARVGGLGGFAHGLPPGHLNLGAVFSRRFLGLWCAAMLLKQISAYNNMLEASRYLSVKDSRQARWAGFLGAGLFVVGLAVWFAPPMAARILFPDLHAFFPRLQNPSEGAFIAMAETVLPVGMMGLIASGLFASTMSAMDAGLNKNAGVFIKNFYQPVIRPEAPDSELLRAGKLATVVLGVFVIASALGISRMTGLGLFLLMQRVSILFNVPIIVPLLLGLLIRRSPPWSGWSTVLVGFATLFLVRAELTPAWAARVFGGGALGFTGAEYWTQGVQVVATLVVGTAWFCATTLWWGRTAPAYRAQVDDFFSRLNTPVDFNREQGAASANDGQQSRAVGGLCLGYGCAVTLLALIPNPAAGRLAFVFCGGLVAGLGTMLLRASRDPRRPASARGRAPSLAIALTQVELDNFMPGVARDEMQTVAERCFFFAEADLNPAGFGRRLEEWDPEMLVACWSTPPLPPRLPPNLRYVCYLAGSVKKLLTRDHIERGLVVTDWGGSVSRVVAECALMLALASLRRAGHWIPAMHASGAWKNRYPDTASLFGRRVGIHGFGRIARELIPLLRPFNPRIGICAPETDPALYAAHRVRAVTSLDELFSQHDIVIELAPLIPATLGVVTDRLLRLMPPGGVFVNVGRGGVVDEAALLRVAREGRIQVALDVFRDEPLPANSGFRGLPNVILLPHLGGPTLDRCRDAGAFGLRNLRAYAAGRRLESVITPEIYDSSS